MTDKQTINNAAAAIADADGWEVAKGYDFVRKHDENTLCSRGRRYLRMAESAFEAITGEMPDLEEDD